MYFVVHGANAVHRWGHRGEECRDLGWPRSPGRNEPRRPRRRQLAVNRERTLRSPGRHVSMPSLDWLLPFSMISSSTVNFFRKKHRASAAGSSGGSRSSSRSSSPASRRRCEPGQEAAHIRDREPVPGQPEQLKIRPPRCQRPRTRLHRVRRARCTRKSFRNSSAGASHSVIPAQNRPAHRPAQ